MELVFPAITQAEHAEVGSLGNAFALFPIIKRYAVAPGVGDQLNVGVADTSVAFSDGAMRLGAASRAGRSLVVKLDRGEKSPCVPSVFHACTCQKYLVAVDRAVAVPPLGNASGSA